MAEHGQVEYATAEGNDLPAHEQMYERFVHLAFVGSVFITNIILALAIVGTTSHWLIAIGLMFVATVVAAFGLARASKAPSAMMLLISLLALGFAAGG
jgi:Bacterial aa3 type cytochrome c oxidase subunit IV